MNNKPPTYHLYADPYTLPGYSVTWCGWVVKDNLAITPNHIDDKYICKRCCPRSDLLKKYFWQVGKGGFAHMGDKINV